MDIIMLCAGYATRLYPLTKDRPKPLLPIAGKPIIEYVLDDFSGKDFIDKVYIVTNDKFYSHFLEWASAYDKDLKIEVINDGTLSNDDRLGAIGDIRYVIDKKALDTDCLVVGGDNIFDTSMLHFVEFVSSNKDNAAIGVYDVGSLELAGKYGLVETDEDGRVLNFQEKPEKPKTTLASLALYYYPKEKLKLFNEYAAEGNNCDQPGRFIEWLSSREDVYAMTFSGAWFDIGDFSSLEEADKYYRTNRV